VSDSGIPATQYVPGSTSDSIKFARRQLVGVLKNGAGPFVTRPITSDSGWAHRRAIDGMSVRRYIFHLQPDDVAASQLAIDGQIEHREIAPSSLDLQLAMDRCAGTSHRALAELDDIMAVLAPRLFDEFGPLSLYAVGPDWHGCVLLSEGRPSAGSPEPACSCRWMIRPSSRSPWHVYVAAAPICGHDRGPRQ
jgi:hypothetical protein